MPLPPALAAKLAKRGIAATPKTFDKENKQDPKLAQCCPNKYNIYHECNTWCKTHWKPQSTPDSRYLRNIRKLLEKYPLPKNCTELYDTGIGRYYYWDMEKNMVSWLPPSHPKSVQSEPACKLRMKLAESNEQQPEPQTQRDQDKRKERHKDRRDKDRDDDRRYKHDDRDRGRRRVKRDDLDPMDPAAYSDIPRGGWSDGLEVNKSKADATASGVLFQQRPYPSPGDVLEANKSKSSKKK